MSAQELIVKKFESMDVFFMEDGYINATKVAKEFGKQASKWLENDETQRYIKAISKKLLLEQNQLVIVKNGALEQIADHVRYMKELQNGCIPLPRYAYPIIQNLQVH